MNISPLSRFLGVAAIGAALAGPMTATPVLADGAVSKSTVYKARLGYGTKILDLAKAADKGDFAAFADKKVQNAFDLFISRSTALNSIKDKEIRAKETAIKDQLYAAVSAKDSSKLKSSYSEFVKVADLISLYKPEEKGQSDSSGYSPAYGTEREYIYQR
eukprot:gene18109-23763_t